MDDRRDILGGSRFEMAQSGIDVEKFGSFIAKLRREKKITQRELAERLYISNKAVSKWERGLSMPDIGLLEPLAEALGVSVTELLHGERQPIEPCSIEQGSIEQGFMKSDSMELTEAESASLVRKMEGDAEKNREILYQIKKKRAILYFSCFVASCLEMALLYLQGDRVDILDEQVSLDVLLVVALPLVFGIWFFFFIREKLPSYYDTEKISYYADGVFRMNMAGVYFNNRNWPHILKAGRLFCILTPVLYPVLYFLLRLAVPYEVWRYLSLFVELTVILGGLFIPMTVAGKKYEKEKVCGL